MADYYDDEADSGGTTREEPEKSRKNTALLPKSFFGDKDLEPGKRCMVRVEHVYDDEVAVSYVPHGTKDDSPPKEPEPDGMYD